ncbi:MAG: hypothetical protein ACKOC5_07615 [Chloroflexota bacterium]
MAEILAAANVLLSGALAALSLMGWLRWRAVAPWAWIKLAYALIGLYWCIVYSFLLLHPESTATTFGQTHIRPGYTFTLGVILASAIIGAKRE